MGSSELRWKKVKWGGHPAAANHPCFEAEVKGGKYRAAPMVYRDRFDPPGKFRVAYEAFFIPDGAKSMADVRDIIPKGQRDTNVQTIGEAREVAEQDYAQQ